jgi:Protein of unknown function (DUF732)
VPSAPPQTRYSPAATTQTVTVTPPAPPPSAATENPTSTGTPHRGVIDPDTTFLSHLGVPITSADAPSLLLVGRQVCTKFANGERPEQVTGDLMASGWTYQQAQAIEIAAKGSYCNDGGNW